MEEEKVTDPIENLITKIDKAATTDEDKKKRSVLKEALNSLKKMPDNLSEADTVIASGQIMKARGAVDWLAEGLRKEVLAELDRREKTVAVPMKQHLKKLTDRVKGIVAQDGVSHKAIAIGVCVFLLIVFLAAGLPLLLNALKAKKDIKKADATLTDQITSRIGKDVGALERRGVSLVGGSDTLQKQAVESKVLTYTLAFKVGAVNSDSDIGNGREFVLLQRKEAAGNRPTFTITADAQMRQLKVGLKKSGSGDMCIFEAEDLPLYRWTVIHVVFNNHPEYRTTHIFIDGKLMKIGNHGTCAGDVADQTGDTIKYGTSSMLDIQYAKVVPRTLMLDEITAEATGIIKDINQFFLDKLMNELQCAL